MEDDFYATIKFKSGEEIFTKVAASEEDGRTMLVLSHPITIQEIKGRMGPLGYKVEPWLKTTKEDMFIVDMINVLTMSESSDMEMILMYQDYIRQGDESKKSQSKISRRMGYISNVHDAKENLEKIFKLDVKDTKS